MSEVERKRSLSESSEEEAEAAKVPRLEEELASLTGVTERSDSDSDSDSSGSDSDSSSSSSSGEEETRNPPKISPTANPPLPASHNQDHTQATQESYNADFQNDHSAADAKNHHSTNDVAQDEDDDEDTEAVNLLAQKLEADQARKRQGSGLSLENPDEFGGSLGAIDELKQFLTVSAEDASGGPVDPVFVNHDSASQHATQMDSLVFEAEGVVGIEDELNEPRLDSVCNSTIHSAEGSLVLGNDVEDGELPSSPEAETEPVEAREVFTDSVAKIGEIYNSSEKGIESVVCKEKKEKRKVQKKSDDESDVDQDGIRQKKRYKKKMKKSKQCEVEKELNVRTEDSSPLKRQKHKKFKSEERAVPSSVTSLAPTPSAVLPPPPSPQHPARPAASAVPPQSSAAKTVPSSLAVKPELAASAVNKCPVELPLRSGGCPVAGLEPAGAGSAVVPLSPAAESSGGGASVACPGQGKARRISLKDYKAKKELERQRRSQGSQEGSGSESNSGPTSQPASKEPSPSPEPSKASHSPPPSAAETTLDTSEADDAVVASDTTASEAFTAASALETTLSSLEDSTSAESTLSASVAESILSASAAESILSASVAESTLGASVAETTISASEASAEVNEMAVDELNSTADALEMEPISDNEIEMANTADEAGNADDALALRDFDVLDELEESDNDTSKESGDESDSLAEDEVDQMLEEKVPNAADEATEDIEPHEKLKKLVLEERGGNLFDVLPLGWVAVTHNSGIPLYLHRDSRVVTASRPYDLGNGSVRKHNMPVSAIPCFSYRYSASLPPAPAPLTPAAPCSSSVPPTDSSNAVTAAASCPYSAPSFSRENVSPDSTTDGAAAATAVPEVSEEISKIFPKAQIETIEESMKKSELTPEEITNYCKKIFVFKELEVAKFKTWKERRAYYKQSQKKKIDNLLSNRPTLPEGTKIITIPSLEMSTIPGTEGDSAINQKVVKKSKKKWLMNPVGKSMVCLLHEYVQQSLKMQPYYTFTELDNAATPYAATVHINKIEYGRGTGSSKKIAKSEAAKRTLEMLIPEIKDKLPSMTGVDEVGDGPDLSFFDDIRVEDPRVAELCNRTSEPAPYQILVTCLQRNYGLGDTHIHQELKAVRNGKNEYTMRVDKREVAVICKNKKDGKQLAAAKLLQQLHPHISSWGSLLRMYGNRSIRTLKKKKEKETEVTGLQSRSSQSAVAPSMAILEKLKEEMRNLRDIKKSIAPIGKFLLPAGSAQTGIHTDHVDF